MYVERLQQKSRNKIVGLYPTVKVTIFLIYALGTLLLALIPMGRWKLPLLLFPNLAVMVLLFGVSGKIKEFVSTVKHLAVMLIIIVSVQVFFIKGENPELVWQFAFVKIHAYGLRDTVSVLHPRHCRNVFLAVCDDLPERSVRCVPENGNGLQKGLCFSVQLRHDRHHAEKYDRHYGFPKSQRRRDAGKYFRSGEGADPVAGSAGGQCVHELRGTGIGIGVQGF